MGSLVWRSWLYPTEPKVLLAKECCGTGVSDRKSTIQHAGARNAVFGSRDFGKNGMAESYDWSLWYVDVGRELQSKKRSEEMYMDAAMESSRKWAVELEKKVSDWKGQEYLI